MQKTLAGKRFTSIDKASNVLQFPATSGKMLGGLLALGLLAALPGSAPAESITFRNDLPLAIQIQGTSIVNRAAIKGQPVLILQGRMGQDARLSPGIRHITIYDANVPGRVLHREPVLIGQGDELRFSIQAAPGNKIRLVPLK